jgi:hypothetical protein
MELLQRWYNGTQDYWAGVRLYNAFGKDALLKKYFSNTTNTVTSRFRLKQAIEGMLYIPQTVPLSIGEGVGVRSSTETVRHDTMPDSPDIVLQSIKDKWMPLYTRMNLLRHNLEPARSERQRGQMAFEILDLEQQCIKLWQQADFYKKNGTCTPMGDHEDKPQLIIDPLKVGIRIEALKRFVRKYKQFLKTTPQHKNAVKWAAKLKQYQDELNQLQNED